MSLINKDNLVESIMEKEKILTEQVKIVDDYIVINVAYAYNIHLHTCRTAEDVLKWVLHLSDKTWITTEVIKRFIFIASREANLNLS